MPDWDPSFEPSIENEPQKPNNTQINRPDNPVFKRRGYNRSDKSGINNLTPVWGVVTEPVKG
jgi:hypothetical protein